jgi:hypothetical protein
MPPKRRTAVSTQQKITDTGIKTSKKRRVIQKPIDLTKAPIKPEKKAGSPTPKEDNVPTATLDDDEFNKEEEVVHEGIDDDLELRKRLQPKTRPKEIESNEYYLTKWSSLENERDPSNAIFIFSSHEGHVQRR